MRVEKGDKGRCRSLRVCCEVHAAQNMLSQRFVTRGEDPQTNKKLEAIISCLRDVRPLQHPRTRLSLIYSLRLIHVNIALKLHCEWMCQSFISFYNFCSYRGRKQMLITDTPAQRSNRQCSQRGTLLAANRVGIEI
jgi:hypothetical protein